MYTVSIIIKILTRVKEHDGLETRELGVINVDLSERLHDLVHHPHADHANIYVHATICLQYNIIKTYIIFFNLSITNY